MEYNKNDIINVATKLGRLVNGGVVGYYAGGKTSEVMRNTIPDELVNVVERHKKVQLGASLAQSFIPGAGVVATSAAVASLWKMYYDINNVLGIKISDNVGKSLTSAVLTNLSSAGAQIGATAVSEGVKFIPFVGWIASAAISTVTSTAIVYGAACLYLTALTKMYEAEGKFDLNYLSSSLEDKDYSSDYDVDNVEDDDDDYVEDLCKDYPHDVRDDKIDKKKVQDIISFCVTNYRREQWKSLDRLRYHYKSENHIENLILNDFEKQVVNFAFKCVSSSAWGLSWGLTDICGDYNETDLLKNEKQFIISLVNSKGNHKERQIAKRVLKRLDYFPAKYFLGEGTVRHQILDSVGFRDADIEVQVNTLLNHIFEFRK